MRRIALGFAVLGLCALSATATLAQPAPIQCDHILRDGTLQVTSFKQSVYFEQAIYSRFSSMSYDESKTERMAGLSVPIGEYVMGSASYGQDDFAKRQREINELFVSTTKYANTVDYGRAAGDPAIIGAWSACVRGQQDLPRLEISFERPSGTDALMTIKWRAGDSTQVSVALANDIDVAPAIVRQGADCLQRGRFYQHGQSCLVRLALPSPMTALVVGATTSGGSASAFLPPRVRIQHNRKPFAVVEGECAGAPPGPPGYVATEVWMSWGARCPPRSIGFAPKGGTQTYSYALLLPSDAASQGWRFDPASAKADILPHWGAGRGNHCDQTEPEKTPYRFTYGYFADGRPQRNVTIVCSVMPTIDLVSDEIVPVP